MTKVGFCGSVALVLSTVAMTCYVGCGSEDSGSSSEPVVDDAGPNTNQTPVDGGSAVKTFSISATVNGLKGKGLVLKDSAAGEVTVTPNGSDSQKVTFPSKLKSGDAFAVSVSTQPDDPPQVCAVAGGSGKVVAADVSSINVNCTDQYTLGGTVSGLDGKNLVLENKSGSETVTINANGTFAFPKPLAPGSLYNVSVKQNPTDNWQTCTIEVGDAGAGDGGVDGSIGNANVTNLNVTCTTNTYAVKVNVTGLVAAATELVLQNNATDDLPVSAVGISTFTTRIASGANYHVTTLQDPGNPWQTCVPAVGVTKMLGADATVNVACNTATFKVGGTLTGLQGNGLVLKNNGADDLTRNGAAANGAFSFLTKVASGSPYVVTVGTQPTGVADERCFLGPSPSGTVAGADITNADVTCKVGKIAFVTSTLYNANLEGLGGADAKCQARAAAGNLPGTYKAWLSDTTGTPAARFTQSTIPYLRVDGAKIANNWADLTDNSTEVAISVTELNTPAPTGGTACDGASAVWTNTNFDGSEAMSSWSCSNWSIGTSVGGQGGITTNSSYTTMNWNCGVKPSCDRLAALYCFQQ